MDFTGKHTFGLETESTEQEVRSVCRFLKVTEQRTTTTKSLDEEEAQKNSRYGVSNVMCGAWYWVWCAGRLRFNDTFRWIQDSKNFCFLEVLQALFISPSLFVSPACCVYIHTVVSTCDMWILKAFHNVVSQVKMSESESFRTPRWLLVKITAIVG